MRTLGEKLCLAGGIAALSVAVLPPLSTLAAQLFFAHMVQHLLLVAVAAPLLAASHVWRVSVSPATAWIAFIAIFLFWHWQAAFQWAAANVATELIELTSILFAAFLFWSTAFDGRELSYGARTWFVMTGAVATDLPGVVMVCAPRAICTMPGENAAAWGLTPLQDQQIAGLLMWVPANLIFFAIATFLFAQWMAPQHKVMTS